MSNYDKNIPVQAVVAGKFRRYHHLTVMQQLLWPSLVLHNIGDSFLVIIGFFQSLFKLIIWRPDVVFTKGGYVCLPVGIAAKILHIPLVIHDSDAFPGLTNRILGKWATKITTGAPLEYYSYPKDRTSYIGIPISPEFRKYSKTERKTLKKKWGIDSEEPLVVVTGGGLGASRINDAVVMELDDILKFCSLILISGVGQYDELRAITPQNNDKFQLHSFISKDMASLLAAADLVVTRAGATTTLELATLAKPIILIPNAKLTGGHQLKNAEVYSKANAVAVINEDEMVNNPKVLLSSIKEVLFDTDKTNIMVKNFSTFARPNAAKDLAKIILSCIK